MYFLSSVPEEDTTDLEEVINLWKAYKFICACIEHISTKDTHLCIEKIREIFGQ